VPFLPEIIVEVHKERKVVIVFILLLIFLLYTVSGIINLRV